MPTYDYACTSCDHTWELFQSIKAEPEKKCPGCGKKKAKRLIGPGAGLIFKGSGFYITDYRSKSYSDAAKADKAPAEASSKAESKTDSGSVKSDNVKSDNASSGLNSVKPSSKD